TGGAEKLIVETLPLYHARGLQVDVLLLNGNEYPFHTELKQKNIGRIISLGSGSVYSPLSILKMIPYLRKYDLIHVHLFPAQYFVIIAKIISFSRTPLVFTEHSTSNRRFNNNKYRFIDRFVYRKYRK